MSDEIDDQPYRVEPRDGRFEVKAASGRTIMVCSDAASAEHYALLLTEAYRAGYRQGARSR